MFEIIGPPLKYFIPLQNLSKHFPRVYKGGPNISPEIIDPLNQLTFYILYVLLMHAKVVQILAKNLCISVHARGPNISFEIFDLLP